MGIFYREKAFHAGKKIRKNDFAPSEKYACYAPACVNASLWGSGHIDHHVCKYVGELLDLRIWHERLTRSVHIIVTVWFTAQ